MDLIDKENIPLFEIGQQPGQIARLVKDRPGGHLQRSPHLVADNIGQRCLSQTRRPMQQDMIESLIPHLGRLNKDL